MASNWYHSRIIIYTPRHSDRFRKNQMAEQIFNLSSMFTIRGCISRHVSREVSLMAITLSDLNTVSGEVNVISGQKVWSCPKRYYLKQECKVFFHGVWSGNLDYNWINASKEKLVRYIWTVTIDVPYKIKNGLAKFFLL